MEVESSSVKENEMGTAPVGQLVVKTSVPMMLSLLAASLYSLVDSIFVSHISEEALTAVSLASPVQLLMAPVGTGLAVGLNAVISKALGEKNQKEVKETVSAAIVIALCGVLFVEPFFRWQSGGQQIFIDYGVPYLRICMVFSIGTMFQWVMDRLLIATGKSSLFLVSLVFASVVNLILDPIFISDTLVCLPLEQPEQRQQR